MNIFITPRVGLDKYNTITLSLEQNWIEYAKKVNINLFIISDPKNLKKDYTTYKPKGLIVSGGGDIYNYDKKLYNLQRDKNEKKIIDFFKNKKLPILGICRGFQLICSYNGINLTRVKNHVKKNHNIYNLYQDKKLNFNKINTNSFHNYAVRKLNNKFEKLAIHDDQTVEIAKLKNSQIYLFMFHPERKNKDQKKIDNLIKKIFKMK